MLYISPVILYLVPMDILQSVRFSRPEMVDGGVADAGDGGRGIDAVLSMAGVMDRGSSRVL